MQSILQSTVHKNVEKRKYSREFTNIFGLSLANYFNNITGFDICKFDEEVLKSPDGKSAADVVKEKYGEAGVKLIENLL